MQQTIQFIISKMLFIVKINPVTKNATKIAAKLRFLSNHSGLTLIYIGFQFPTLRKPSVLPKASVIIYVLMFKHHSFTKTLIGLINPEGNNGESAR
jgi:hypothetical protein